MVVWFMQRMVAEALSASWILFVKYMYIKLALPLRVQTLNIFMYGCPNCFKFGSHKGVQMLPIRGSNVTHKRVQMLPIRGFKCYP